MISNPGSRRHSPRCAWRWTLSRIRVLGTRTYPSNDGAFGMDTLRSDRKFGQSSEYVRFKTTPDEAPGIPSRRNGRYMCYPLWKLDIISITGYGPWAAT